MSAVRDARRAELAKIHIAKAQLGLDDETYRAMLWTIGRVHSAAELGDAGRRAVLDHLKARGFTAAKRPVNAPLTRGVKPAVAADRQAQIGKIEALLADAARPWAYVEAMARRMCHVDALRFCTSAQLGMLIAALEYDRRRRAAKASA